MQNSQLSLESKTILQALPKFFFYWKTYFWTMLFSIFSVALILPQELQSLGQIASWSIVAVSSHLAMLPFFFYAQNHREMKAQVTLVVLAGITRGVVMVLITPIFGLEDDFPSYFRILNIATATAYWLLFGSILIEFMINFRKDLRNLLVESIAESKDLPFEAPDVNSPILLARITELKKKITNTVQGDASPENLRKRAADIEKLVRSEIRPLSHSEWHGDNLRWAKAGFFRILRASLNGYPIPVLGTILLTLPFSISDQLPRNGFILTLITLTLWTTILVLVRKVAIRLGGDSSKKILKSNLYFLSGVYVFAVPAMMLLHTSIASENTTIFEILKSVLARNTTFAILCCASVICISLANDVQSVFRTLSSEIKTKDERQFLLSGLMERSSTEYGEYLHAVVQSQLVACKLLLLKFAEDDFSNANPEIVKQILDRLEGIDIPYVAKSKGAPIELMKDLAHSWRGIAEITYDLDEKFGLSADSERIATQLVEEAIINSIRHGKASKIHVEMKYVENSLHIMVSDNGILEVKSSSRGLGSILFDNYTSHWSISREFNRTVLRMTINHQAK